VTEHRPVCGICGAPATSLITDTEVYDNLDTGWQDSFVTGCHTRCDAHSRNPRTRFIASHNQPMSYD
jgi:hypothetical protein